MGRLRRRHRTPRHHAFSGARIVTALVGANGAGKSTLAAVIAGIVAVERGPLSVRGSRHHRRSPPSGELGRALSSLPRREASFLDCPSRTISPSACPGSRSRRGLRAVPHPRGQAQVPAGTLSGGEQQMLALGSILVNPPKLLVADEPTLGLAPQIVEQVLGIVRVLRDRGVAVLLIEEKARSVMDVADYVAVLELGHWSGPGPAIGSTRSSWPRPSWVGKAPSSSLRRRARGNDERGCVVAKARRLGGTGRVGQIRWDRRRRQRHHRDHWPMRSVDLIGPNGAGKTTLFDTLAGLRSPSTGAVELDGVDVTGRSATWRSRHGIRRTFQRQQPFGLLSVEDNILAAMEWRGGGGGPLGDLFHVPMRTRRERQRRISGCRGYGAVPAWSSTKGSCRYGYPSARSEWSRSPGPSWTTLASCSSTSRRLVSMRSSSLRWARMIQQIRDEESCGIVLVEHNVGFVMHNCSRIVVLNLGRVIAEGSPDVVRQDAAVAAAYLG